MHQLQGRRAAVELTRIGFLQDDHAAPLDPRVVRIDRRRDEIGEVHISDEAAALLDLKDRILAVLPFGDADFAGHHPGIHPDIGQRFGQGESAATDFPVLAGLGRGAAAHVMEALFRRAFFVDRGEGQVAGQGAGRRAAVDPRQFEGDQRQGQILRPDDKAALLGLHEDRGQPRLVETEQQLIFSIVPFVRVTGPFGHETGYRGPRQGAGRLHGHLQIETIRVAPHDLTDVISRKGAYEFLLATFEITGHHNSPLVTEKAVIQTVRSMLSVRTPLKTVLN